MVVAGTAVVVVVLAGAVVGGDVVAGDVVAVGREAVEVVVAGGTVVAVDVVVVAGSTTLTPVSGRPPSDEGSVKDWIGVPLVACSMKRRQIVAGNEPPLTARPRTDVMVRLAPSGQPIHTAAVSVGV